MTGFYESSADGCGESKTENAGSGSTLVRESDQFFTAAIVTLCPSEQIGVSRAFGTLPPLWQPVSEHSTKLALNTTAMSTAAPIIINVSLRVIH
jgi:hypothetical protein